ncbi:MAG: hypothetical protein AB7F86_08925 [Bdellovibrionales bacterium]
MRQMVNIKQVVTNPILPVDSRQKVEGNARSQASADRDGNGKREEAEREPKRHLSQQEFDDCLKVLKEFPGLKANALSLKVEKQDDHRVVLIVDGSGRVVRRLSESQLWSATRDRDRQTGRILDKAM